MSNTITSIQTCYQQNTLAPVEHYQHAFHVLNQADSAIFIHKPSEQATIDSYDSNKPLSGILFSVKDTFNQAGLPTRAASILPQLALPVTTTATAISRLEAAGAIAFGRTNMSEFAFSGLGLNPHYGTPANAIDASLIPGGSSSGGAISVARGLCEFALGTDTGGSLRIPAAFNGLVGFKPSQSTVPHDGCFALSPSLDCIGPIARTVSDCQTIWKILSQSTSVQSKQPKKRLLVPTNIVLDNIATEVRFGFNQALDILQANGWEIHTDSLTALDAVNAINRAGGLVLPESAWVHRHLLATSEGYYDPLIAARIKQGQHTTLNDYISRLQQRPLLQQMFTKSLSNYDALLCPTVAILPPTIKTLSSSAEKFNHYNRLILRNTALFNYLGVPSISLPFSVNKSFPIGLMFSGLKNNDTALLNMAVCIERILTSNSSPFDV